MFGPKAAGHLVRVVLAAPEALGLAGAGGAGRERGGPRGAGRGGAGGQGSDQEIARLSRLLQPHARRLARPAIGSLSRAARARLKKSLASAEPLLALLGLADAGELATVLREEAAKASPDRARELYTALVKSERARDEDRLALARLLLVRSHLDLASRGSDPCLELFSALARRGVPVADDLAADPRLTPEHRFYVGFHLADICRARPRDRPRGAGGALEGPRQARQAGQGQAQDHRLRGVTTAGRAYLLRLPAAQAGPATGSSTRGSLMIRSTNALLAACLLLAVPGCGLFDGANPCDKADGATAHVTAKSSACSGLTLPALQGKSQCDAALKNCNDAEKAVIDEEMGCLSGVGACVAGKEDVFLIARPAGCSARARSASSAASPPRPARSSGR